MFLGMRKRFLWSAEQFQYLYFSLSKTRSEQQVSICQILFTLLQWAATSWSNPCQTRHCHSSFSQSWFPWALKDNRTHWPVRTPDVSSLGHLLPDCHWVLSAQCYAVPTSLNQFVALLGGSEYVCLLSTALESPLCRSRSPWKAPEAINPCHLGAEEVDCQDYVLPFLHMLIKLRASTESNCIKPLRTIMNS